MAGLPHCNFFGKGQAMKKLHRKSLYHYATALFVFLCYLGICIGIFFYGIQKAVADTARVQLADNVTRQCDHLKDVMDLEFENLEGLAGYLGGQDNPVTAENGALLRAMVDESSFVRMTYGTKEGDGYASDGTEVQNMSGQDFFKTAIGGRRVVSDPIESALDGTNLIVLAVPVYDDSGSVTGVLAGSYDVSRLSEIFFGDLYGGSGYVYIINRAGESIMMDKKHGEDRRGQTFFEFYSNVTFEKGSSLAQVQADLADGTGAVCRVSRDGDTRYLAYEPIGYNNWFICYAVPEENAQQAYAFIRDYEIVLSLFVMAGLIILLAVLQYTNVRDRNQLEVKAQTDAMTGLLNAVSTRENVDVWLQGDACRGMQALIMLDVDRFKDVNDTYGHAVGDEALRQSAALLRRHFRGSDIVGRVGGDEFIVFMKNIPGDAIVSSQLEKLCQAFHAIRIAEAQDLRLTCSAGAALARPTAAILTPCTKRPTWPCTASSEAPGTASPSTTAVRPVCDTGVTTAGYNIVKYYTVK